MLASPVSVAVGHQHARGGRFGECGVAVHFAVASSRDSADEELAALRASSGRRRLAMPKLECDRKATLGVRPKPRTSPPPSRDVGEQLRRRDLVDVGVGDEQRALGKRQPR